MVAACLCPQRAVVTLRAAFPRCLSWRVCSLHNSSLLALAWLDQLLFTLQWLPWCFPSHLHTPHQALEQLSESGGSSLAAAVSASGGTGAAATAAQYADLLPLPHLVAVEVAKGVHVGYGMLLLINRAAAAGALQVAAEQRLAVIAQLR